MSGEQWGEAVDAAARVYLRYSSDGDHYETLPFEADRAHCREAAAAIISAAAELIVADTRRKVAEELLAYDPDDPHDLCCNCARDRERFAAIVRGGDGTEGR